MEDPRIFREIEKIVMEYNTLDKPKSIIEKIKRKYLKNHITKTADRVKESKITVPLLLDFVSMYNTYIDEIFLDGITIDNDDFSHEIIIAIVMRNDRKICIGLKGAWDPNYLSLSIGTGTKEYNKFGRMEFVTGIMEYNGNAKAKRDAIDVVIDLLHDTFSTYIRMYLEKYM